MSAVFRWTQRTHFGRVVSGPHHVTWRGTTIKTGDRTLKIKLERNIPQSFMTLEGKTKITTRYTDQPKTCFECGSLDHERKDCPVNERDTYAQAVADAQKPSGSEEMFNIDVVLPEVTPDVTQTSKSYKKKKEKKKLKKMLEEGAFMTSTPDPKRKDRSSSDTSPTFQAKHTGLPQRIPIHKVQKQSNPNDHEMPNGQRFRSVIKT